MGAEVLAMCIASDLDRGPLGTSGGVGGFCLVIRELAWSLGLRMLVLSLVFRSLACLLMGHICRDVDQNMVIKRRGRTGVRVMLGKCWWVGRNLIVFQDAVLASGGREYFSQNSKLGLGDKERRGSLGCLGLCWVGSGMERLFMLLMVVLYNFFSSGYMIP